jgi:hypothetical protein
MHIPIHHLIPSHFAFILAERRLDESKKKDRFLLSRERTHHNRWVLSFVGKNKKPR